ncbi:MAG TPA: PPOX class F420-dependent oxidoreductase [Thermomicrobiales bacterium]|jgi:PPOX class probable F420-dependent enzyme|nr:PPOX class F420-dependent oxidoreductase [Thermomicrobiales bacterium]
MVSMSEGARALIDAANVGILTTLGPDGAPQTTALWYLFEDGQVKISLNTSRQKARNLSRDPRVSFFLMDPANPYRTVEFRGTATVEPDDDYRFAERIGARYGGANLRDNDRPGETRVVVTIAPVKVLTFGI